MAHYVARVLKQRPNDILDHWGVAELVVAFGHYANEDADKNYQEWKSLHAENRAKVEKPSPYTVRFFNSNESDA